VVGESGVFATHHTPAAVEYPVDAASVTDGSEQLLFEATATVVLSASFTQTPNAVVNQVISPPVLIKVTRSNGTPQPGAECTITDAVTNNGTNTDILGRGVPVTSDAQGICTFDSLTPTKTGALHFEATITLDGASNSPLVIVSGKFNVKTK